MANVIKRDESILTDKEKTTLNRTMEKLEQFYPEHKVYAMDALCAQQRETSAKYAKKLGYSSVAELLSAYGFESIKGAEVYELRKNCGIRPGEEPELIKERIDNAITSLDEYYPDHIIEGSFNKQHSNLFSKLTGFYQWLGYKSMEDMLAAYGFTYNAKLGRLKSVDPKAIIAELKIRYPEGTTMTLGEIRQANPDLKIKSVMNISQEIFGMSFADYLANQGITINRKISAEEKETSFREKEREDLKWYDVYIQKKYLGWKKLPFSAAELMDYLNDIQTTRKLKAIFSDLQIDADKHFGELGLIRNEDDDNEYRRLIQYISFGKVVNDTSNINRTVPVNEKDSAEEKRKTTLYGKEALDALIQRYSDDPFIGSIDELLCNNGDVDFTTLRRHVKNKYKGIGVDELLRKIGVLSEAIINKTDSISDSNNDIEAVDNKIFYPDDYDEHQEVEIKNNGNDNDLKIKVAENTFYEISRTINDEEQPLYVLMTGAGIRPEKQYESDYEPESLDELFYNYPICNGIDEELDEFGRVVNGISYDLNKILAMIPTLQKEPLYKDETKYYIIKAGRFVEEFQDTYPFVNFEKPTGDCYIVIKGYEDAVEEYLGVFPNLDQAVIYRDMLTEAVWNGDADYGEKIEIIKAKMDTLPSKPEFFDEPIDLEDDY